MDPTQREAVPPRPRAGARLVRRVGPVLVVLAAVVFPLRLAAWDVLTDGGVPSPSGISGAERAAVQLAVDYVSRGAASWIPALSRSSWLSRIPAEEAKAEIEARVGPVEGATWELATVYPDFRDRTAVFVVEYPSGLETRLILDFVQEGSAWRLKDVRTWSQRQPESATRGAGTTERGRKLLANPWAASLVLLAIGALAAAAGFLLHRLRRRGVRPLLIVGGAFAALAFPLGLLLRARGGRSAAPEGDRLASLRAARTILATSEPDSIRSALARLPSQGAAGDIARLWKAEWALHEGDYARASGLLHAFPPDSRIPEVEQLRARLAFFKNEPGDVARFYEAATRLGPVHDGLALEAAQLLALMDDETNASHYVLEAAHNGSRLAEVAYAQAAYWIRQQRGVDAESWFKRGWQLRPVERASLFSQGIFWDLLRRPDLWGYLQLSSANEPVLRAPETGKSPITASTDAQARLCGAYLRIRAGTARLNIPGGAALAPEGTPVDDAGGWSRAEEQEALSELPRLFELSGSGAPFLQPLLARRIETAALTLAGRRRWEDLVRLTEPVSAAIERAPSDLVLLRVEALRRANRAAEGRDLLQKAAASESFLRRSTPGTLFSFARALNSVGDYDRAIQFAETASAKLRVPAGRSLIQRIRMERRLASSYSTYDSAHFSIHYPREHPESGTRKLAAVLEGERERLRGWIPIPSSSKTRIEVQLLWFRDFQKTFSGGTGVVGVFDGRIRLPFAGGESLDFSDPDIVSIVTHELAHAMICEATLDQAPSWLHEGLAQHVEMRREHFNPMPLYEKQGRFLALPVVEGVLEGFPAEDLAEISYEESLWSLHYMESALGRGAIHRLLAAFREGSTTEDALKRVSYGSVPDFEDRFRKWSRLPSAQAWSVPILRYMGDQPRSARLPAALDEQRLRMRLYDSGDNPVPVITPVH